MTITGILPVGRAKMALRLMGARAHATGKSGWTR
jgi:hypothetical protein